MPNCVPSKWSLTQGLVNDFQDLQHRYFEINISCGQERRTVFYEFVIISVAEVGHGRMVEVGTG